MKIPPHQTSLGFKIIITNIQTQSCMVISDVVSATNICEALYTKYILLQTWDIF